MLTWGSSLRKPRPPYTPSLTADALDQPQAGVVNSGVWHVGTADALIRPPLPPTLLPPFPPPPPHALCPCRYNENDTHFSNAARTVRRTLITGLSPPSTPGCIREPPRGMLRRNCTRPVTPSRVA
jgi:hypothetical protein